MAPISLISCLMGIAENSRDWSGDPVPVVGMPPLAVMAGIGLLRRKNWARIYLILVMEAVLAWNVDPIIKGPDPGSTFISPGGGEDHEDGVDLAISAGHHGHLRDFDPLFVYEDDSCGIYQAWKLQKCRRLDDADRAVNHFAVRRISTLPGIAE